MRILSTHSDFDEAIAAIHAAAPDATEHEVIARGFDPARAKAFYSRSTALTYLARHGDGDSREPIEVLELTVPELLRDPAVAGSVDTALTVFAEPGRSSGVEAWHENLLIEAFMAQIDYARVQVAAETGRPPGDETDAMLVERYLQEQIEVARREMTRLAMARAEHISMLLSNRRGRHGAKSEVARLLGISPQSVQDAVAAEDRRWTAARRHRVAHED